MLRKVKRLGIWFDTDVNHEGVYKTFDRFRYAGFMRLFRVKPRVNSLSGSKVFALEWR